MRAQGAAVPRPSPGAHVIRRPSLPADPDGSVNRTAEFFAALAADPATQVAFEASIPSQHCMPTVDPWLSPASCGVNAPWAPPAMENCGYDGAGAALQHMYSGSLTPPPQGAGPDPACLFSFDQTLYLNGTLFGGLATQGFVYVPTACEPPAPCRVHVAMHGCGMGYAFAAMNSSFVLHAGYGPWADANGLVVLFPQGGYFHEHGLTAPAAQVGAGCFDGECAQRRGGGGRAYAASAPARCRLRPDGPRLRLRGRPPDGADPQHAHCARGACVRARGVAAESLADAVSSCPRAHAD